MGEKISDTKRVRKLKKDNRSRYKCIFKLQSAVKIFFEETI